MQLSSTCWHKPRHRVFKHESKPYGALVSSSNSLFHFIRSTLSSSDHVIDGRDFSTGTARQFVAAYEVAIRIDELPAYPIDGHPSPGAVKQRLLARGMPRS